MSMNNITRLPYLESWCKSYFDKVGLKIHPSNVPTEIVLNDIMEQLTMLICHEKGEVTAYDAMNERIKAIESELETIKTKHNILFDRFVDLETRVDSILLQAAGEVVKESKKVKK